MLQDAPPILEKQVFSDFFFVRQNNPVNNFRSCDKSKNIFTFGYTYNPSSGMLETYTYPSGFALKYVYNQRGDMSSIFGFFGTYWGGLWSGTQQNQRGQWTSYGGPSLFNTNFYDDYGYPSRTVVLNLHTKAFVQDYRYGFEPATGNLSWRTDAVRGLTESFTYDDDENGLYSRLTGWSVNSQNLAELQYQANGNISRKTDVSAAHNSYHYQHPQGKPHAVTSVSQPTPAFVSAAPEQSIEYTAFNKVKTLINSYNFGSRQDKLDITYGPDNQRKFSRLTEDEGVGMPFITDTYYLGQYETKRDLLTFEQKIHYLNGPTGLFGILVKQANTEKLYYVLKDHLGSITGIADASGNILEDLSYDPWGRRRNANDWTDYNVTPTRFDRGYTGHEHLGQFGLINMNGRVYDPFLARFLSPDPQLQSPDYSQNYNRYSYAWNNPLKYTDPSGEFIFTALALLIPGAQFLLPVAIGADIGAITGGIRGANSDVGFWAGAGRGALVGGVGGGLSMIGGAGMPFISNLALGTGSGAFTGGLDAALWGNDIGEGMLWGATGGAIFTTFTSENFSNLTKGEGFYTNKNVFINMEKRGMDRQAILDYFGFEGTYTGTTKGPSYVDGGGEGASFYGSTNSKTGSIKYGDLAFDSYDKLKMTYNKEMYHSLRVKNGIPLETQGTEFGKHLKYYPEERLGFIHAYKNQGLYPSAGKGLMSNISYYQIQSFNLNPSQYYSAKWWHFIYKIPRRW